MKKTTIAAYLVRAMRPIRHRRLDATTMVCGLTRDFFGRGETTTHDGRRVTCPVCRARQRTINLKRAK